MASATGIFNSSSPVSLLREPNPEVVPPLLLALWPLVGLLLTLALCTLPLYVDTLRLAWRRAHSTAHRGERAWARHHAALLLHVAILDVAASLLLAPLELASLSAQGVWWPLPRAHALCRAALGLEAFLGAAAVYGVAALGLHATSHQCQQPPRATATNLRYFRVLRVPVCLPLIWLMASLLAAPLVAFGQLVTEPEGMRCVVFLPPRSPSPDSWNGLDRLMLALLRALFVCAIPLLLLLAAGVRAALKLQCSGSHACRGGASRLHLVTLLWTVVFVLLSLNRSIFGAAFSFSQAVSLHPTHLSPPFVSITSAEATLVFSALHFASSVLRPLLYILACRVRT